MAAMGRRPVDRTPVFPVVTAYLGSRALDRPYDDIVLNPLLAYEGLRAVVDRFGFDGIEAPMGPPAGWREGLQVIDGSGGRFLVHPTSGELLARLQPGDNPIPINREPPLMNKRDLDSIPVTPAEQYIEEGRLEPLRALVEDIGDSVFIAGQAAGQTMNSLAQWRGGDQAMLDLRDDPGFVLEVMERATAISIEVGRAMVAAGVHGIYIGDAWASASVISPRDYERFCQPFHTKAAEAFHRMGVRVYLHICGECAPILEMMADTGVDAIEPLDRMDAAGLASAKRRVGERVCLKGGVDTLALLTSTPDEVHRLCVEAIRAAGPVGYILGSADDIPRDTPFENIDAMVRAALG